MLEKNIKKVIEGVYPFHMPGHKRQKEWLEGLFDADITEICGTDNLHAPSGIIDEAQKKAAELFGVNEILFLTGGSTSGILSAITAACKIEDKILIARNCHKSVYNACIINRLKVSFVYPKQDVLLGCAGQVTPWDVAEEMDRSGAKVVVITSPTYEGIVSDTARIAKEVHLRDGILIVDAAHGAHFGFNDYFPKSARQLGADIVIESAHKTLPCLTGSALLHICTERVDTAAVKRAVGIYLTSSPPYPILCSIDRFVHKASEGDLFSSYIEKLEAFYSRASSLSKLKITRVDDPSKIIISTRGTSINGFELKETLLKDYKIEIEMALPEYAMAMTSLADSYEGLGRLSAALEDIDQKLSVSEKKPFYFPPKPKIKGLFTEKESVAAELVSLEQSAGRISLDFIFAYPPGCPIVAPGEEITTEIVEYIEDIINMKGQILSDGQFFPNAVRVYKEKD